LISEKVPVVVERIAEKDPLGVVVGADVGFYSDGWSVVLPRDLDESTTPAEGLDHLEARTRLVEAGASDLRETHLLLGLEGKSRDPVKITGLRSRVRSRQAPLGGAMVRSPSAGEQRIVAALFDLDQDESVARSDDGQDYFHSYELVLGRAELFTYRIVARVERSAAEWELVLTYSHRGVGHELILDAAGEPFRTAARSNTVRQYEWAWYERPSRVVDIEKRSAQA
jgi:hypothetical protein